MTPRKTVAALAANGFTIVMPNRNRSFWCLHDHGKSVGSSMIWRDMIAEGVRLNNDQAALGVGSIIDVDA